MTRTKRAKAKANCRAKDRHADWYGAAVASLKTMFRDVRRDPYAPTFARPYECDICGFWHVTSQRPRVA